jgi:hypothetical protein
MVPSAERCQRRDSQVSERGVIHARLWRSGLRAFFKALEVTPSEESMNEFG